MKNSKAVRGKSKPPVQVDNGIAETTRPQSLQKVEAKPELALPTSGAEAMVMVKRVLAQATGVRDAGLGALITDQLIRLQAPSSLGDATNGGLDIALATMLEMKPETITEALLAVQMVGVHHAALASMRKATSLHKVDEHCGASMAVATSLMRLYIEQLEAMAKLKGKTGQQKVTVEHVHIHDGGQAIVGAVSAGRSIHGEGGKGAKRTKTP